MDKRKIFLAISYTKKGKAETAITKFFINKGFAVKVARSLPPGKHIDEGVSEMMDGCNFGVVVYNELRHNISYEWGLLDGLKKRVFLLVDGNLHIDLDKEISDKKGVVYTTFCGEDSEEEIIKHLGEDEGLMSAIEDCIGKAISEEQTPDVEKAAELMAKSNLPLAGITKKDIKVDDINEIIEALNGIKKLTAEGHFNKANAHYYAKEYDKAEEELRKAIEINPEHAKAHYTLGVLLSDLKRFDEAEKEYHEVKRITEKCPKCGNIMNEVTIDSWGGDSDGDYPRYVSGYYCPKCPYVEQLEYLL